MVRLYRPKSVKYIVLKLMRALPGMSILMILLLGPANAILYKGNFWIPGS